MTPPTLRFTLLCLAVGLPLGCGVEDTDEDATAMSAQGNPGEIELSDAADTTSTSDALTHCFCTGQFACGHSSSPSFNRRPWRNGISSSRIDQSSVQRM